MKPLLLLGLWGLLWMGCTDDSISKQPGLTRDIYPDQESWESTVIISTQGKLIAVAKSDRMVKYENQKMAHLIGTVNVDFYNDRGQHVSHLLADTADVNIQNNNLTAIGNVVIRSDSGMVLETNIINWNNQYEMLSTEDTVRFTSLDQDTLFGIGFESDVDLSHGRIYRPWGVTGRGFGGFD
ncbi:MAG: LPS export ABC transporter periplasmic protein LptC [Candidatus Marinimicrobia bacterium]|nr:LPS export ABC transporter periplasmic protein LptC [Candidatus Neomarinimicrobiota bacterium]